MQHTSCVPFVGAVPSPEPCSHSRNAQAPSYEGGDVFEKRRPFGPVHVGAISSRVTTPGHKYTDGCEYEDSYSDEDMNLDGSLPVVAEVPGRADDEAHEDDPRQPHHKVVHSPKFPVTARAHVSVRRAGSFLSHAYRVNFKALISISK